MTHKEMIRDALLEAGYVDGKGGRSFADDWEGISVTCCDTLACIFEFDVDGRLAHIRASGWESECREGYRPD